MRLSELLPGVDAAAFAGLEIMGVTADSREAGAGFAFFAIPGFKGDGLDFVADAKARGAVAVVASRPAECGLPVIVVPDVRAALSVGASLFYPRQPQVIAAVTGTSGKSSVVDFLRQLWTAAGRRTASLGTVGLVDESGARYGSLTTPGPVELHRTLDDLALRGITHLAMEASSLGIDQRRLDGVRLAVGAFTNFSRDHLDLHADLEDYFAAKMRLFEALLPAGRTAVIDADSDAAERVAAICRGRGLDVFGVGARGEGIRLLSHEPFGLESRLRVRCGGKDYEVKLPLGGRFQVSNALVAAALAIVAGEDAAATFCALEALKGAPGRLELAGSRNGAPIFVDYAHKPDALEKVLQTVRPLAPGRLLVIFGAGGDRDKGKRSLMGEAAGRLADVVIVSDDNPRSEDPALIRAPIVEAARSCVHALVLDIGDRRLAISEAVNMLRPGDALVVAGKGHELGQIVGDQVLPYSDHAAIAAALRE